MLAICLCNSVINDLCNNVINALCNNVVNALCNNVLNEFCNIVISDLLINVVNEMCNSEWSMNCSFIAYHAVLPPRDIYFWENTSLVYCYYWHNDLTHIINFFNPVGREPSLVNTFVKIVSFGDSYCSSFEKALTTVW